MAVALFKVADLTGAIDLLQDVYVQKITVILTLLHITNFCGDLPHSCFPYFVLDSFN